MMHISLDMPTIEQNVDLNRIDNPEAFCYKRGSKQKGAYSMTQWIIVIINGVLTGTVAWLLHKLTSALDESAKKATEDKKQQEDERRIMHGVLLAILKNSLYDQCFTALKRGSISLKEKENIDSLYTQYHTLGGNHNGDILYRRVDALEIVPDDDDKMQIGA